MGTRRIKKKSPYSFVINLAIAAFAVGFIASLLLGSVERDPVTLCRLDNDVPRETALLLDETVGYSQPQASAITRHLDSLLTNSLADERFTFYSLGSDENSYYLRFSFCNPGDGSDQGELTADQRQLYNGWKEILTERLGIYVNALIEKEAADSSPIVDMVQYVANQIRFTPGDVQKRLILVSSLIHHTPSYSHERDSTNFNAFLGTRSSEDALANLEDVEVEIVLIQRPQLLAIQNRGHIEAFWRPFVNQSGGAIVATERIMLE
ncbi:MAG TPA: hypothetical protein DCM64_00395 [Gammaproteobacteria bacterium]|nr:hypothetical protein [Gammaproteobacteria bacterium]MDP6733914.1 hypothetical protein [Gammaproteobacteria bacterium]HAJ74893.1 hypothetical protein [Gammaproteobacteria bacterium]